MLAFRMLEAASQQGAALWKPSNWTGALALWADASDAATVTLSGANVTGLADKSGNARDFSAYTTYYPTVSAGAINGLDALLFSAAEMRSVAWAGSTNLTMFLVHQELSYPVNFPNPIQKGAVNTIWTYIFSSSANAAPYTATQFWRTGSGTTAQSAQNINVLNQTYVTGADQSNGVSIDLYDTGNQIATLASSSTATTTSDSVRLGQGSTGNAANMLMGEVIVIDSFLSTTDRQKFEGYLAWKWGAQSKLPSGHPYKSAPPYA